MNKSNACWVTCNLTTEIILQFYPLIKSLNKVLLCHWLWLLWRNETAEQEDYFAGGSTTAEWRAGKQAATSFQPSGSREQDKASLFKTPPTSQIKWESCPCCLTRSPLTTQMIRNICIEGTHNMFIPVHTHTKLVQKNHSTSRLNDNAHFHRDSAVQL